MVEGAVLAERFVLDELVGEGGMASVWRARDEATGATVAVKLLTKSTPRFVDRFEREIQVLGELDHPAIVGLVDSGATDAGDPFLVMQWLSGHDLDERLTERPLTLGEALRLGVRVADALGAAHERGFVHRDIKPSNLLLVDHETDKVTLVDFGIAGWAAAPRSLTGEGVALGTPGYMAPEQARGDQGTDARADVFSLGCVLYECVTGRPAFSADNLMALLVKVLFEPIEAPGSHVQGLPPALDELLLRLLDKERGGRPPDGRAVAEELRVIAKDLGAQAAMASPRRSERPPALTEGERRLVSVLVAYAGPAPGTPLDATIEERGTDDLPTTLAELLQRFGARLERLAGGSFAILLEPRGCATDQAAIAARCALAVQGVLPSLPLSVATGRAELGGALPLGEAIDRAVAPFDAIVAEGTIRIDDLTAGLLDNRFEVAGDDLGLRLVGERPAHHAARRILGRQAPFVGRRQELGTCRLTLDESVEHGLARAVLVTGGPGVGKSRLIDHALEEHEAPLEVWRARGDPSSPGVPLDLLTQLLRGAVGLLQGEALAVRQRRLRARVARNLPKQDVDRVVEFLAELLGCPFEDPCVQLMAARRDPVLMGDQLRRAAMDLLRAECRESPLVLVLDDLHWGDRQTFELLDRVLADLEEQPLVVFAMGQPEVEQSHPQLFAQRGATWLRLGPLPRKASRELVRSVLGDGPSEERVDELVSRSSGNALYLEEVVRAEAEGRPGVLPATIVAMAQARLEALAPASRRVLRAASVFGDTFCRGAVVQLLGGDRHAGLVDVQLSVLSQRELLVASPTRYEDEVEYSFRHRPLQEASYAMLTDSDRRLAHRLAARWLESVGETAPHLLADHHEQSDQPEHAVPWHIAAAEAALDANDFEEARDRTQRALAHEPEGELLGRAHLTLAEAWHWKGVFKAASGSARIATEALPVGTEAWFAAVSLSARLSQRIGGIEHLRGLADDLATLRRAPPAAELAARVHVGIALVMGRDPAGATLIDSIGEEELTSAEPGIAAYVHRARAAVAHGGGDPVAYLTEMKAAALCFERAGNLRNVIAHRTNIGYALLELGLLEEAEQELRTVVQSAEGDDLEMAATPARHNLGLVLFWQGQLDEAAALERSCAEAFHEQGDMRLEGGSWAYLAGIEEAQGNLEAAEEAARRALELLALAPPIRVYAQAALASVLLSAGRLEEADAASAEAMEALVRGAVPSAEALARLTRARVLKVRGDLDGAREVVAEAAARILERAEGIDRPDWRQSFLERVPSHHQTLALHRELS